jgi:protein TonB
LTPKLIVPLLAALIVAMPAIAQRPSSPAAAAEEARKRDDYRWAVLNKLREYRYSANVNAVNGITVAQIVVARDGRLLDAQIIRSSGVAAMDEGVLTGLRKGSPYAPLPRQIPGSSATFELSLVSMREGR